jgi:hypothetical protein
MQTETGSKNNARKLGSYLFNFGLITGLATLTFGLISCGGGGATTNPGNTTPTITSITPSGMVASSVPKALSILGTNFVSGMTLSIANSSGVVTGYTITASSVTSSTVLAVSAVISAAPTDNYVNFAIKSSAGTTLASTVFGVASANKTLATDIQAIFDAKCVACHGGSGGLYLNNGLSAAGLITTNSVGCSAKFRVAPGDPRRASSVLIDKIKATPSSAACFGTPMPQTGPLTAQEIQDIVDWVAAGAN